VIVSAIGETSAEHASKRAVAAAVLDRVEEYGRWFVRCVRSVCSFGVPGKSLDIQSMRAVACGVRSNCKQSSAGSLDLN